jgi:hypothetical protein
MLLPQIIDATGCREEESHVAHKKTSGKDARPGLEQGI